MARKLSLLQWKGGYVWLFSHGLGTVPRQRRKNPPGLATIIPYEGPINAYHYSMRAGGALHLGLLKWILETAATSQEAQQNPAIAEAVRTMSSGQNFLNWASRIPWKRGQTPLSIAPKYEDAAFQLYFENYDYTDFWRQPRLCDGRIF